MIAGGVHSKGWADNTPDSWKQHFTEETNKTWFKIKGASVRRKLAGRASAFAGWWNR